MPLRYAKKKLYIENTKENRGNIRANERFDVIVVGAGASVPVGMGIAAAAVLGLVVFLAWSLLQMFFGPVR